MSFFFFFRIFPVFSLKSVKDLIDFYKSNEDAVIRTKCVCLDSINNTNIVPCQILNFQIRRSKQTSPGLEQKPSDLGQTHTGPTSLTGMETPTVLQTPTKLKTSPLPELNLSCQQSKPMTSCSRNLVK